MAKQEECSKCKRAKQGGYAGEIKCSFYGRKPLFDDSPCSNFLNVNIKCPECGQEVPPSEKVCPNCGCPMKEESPQKSSITQSDNSSQNTTNTTKKSNKTPLYTLLILLGLGVLIGLPVYIISRENKAKKEAEEAAKQEMLVEAARQEQERIEQEQQEKERIEQERKKQELEQYRLEQERRENAAPYGYNEYGEPYDSEESARLDKRLTDWENARNDFFMTDNPLEKMLYQQRMRYAIDDCCRLAKEIGNRQLLAEMIRLREATNALSDINNW